MSHKLPLSVQLDIDGHELPGALDRLSVVFHDGVFTTGQNGCVSVDIYMKIAPVGGQVLDVSGADLLHVLGFSENFSAPIGEREFVGIDPLEDVHVSIPDRLILLALNLENFFFNFCIRLFADGILSSGKRN